MTSGPEPAGDTALARATAQIVAAQSRPHVHPFFDAASSTISYVVHDPQTGTAAIIDPVLGYAPASGRTNPATADDMIAYVRAKGLEAAWILETHVHADHLTAAHYLKRRIGAKIATGSAILTVCRTFRDIFNDDALSPENQTHFDQFFTDGDGFAIGTLPMTVLHVPGHTSACSAYVIGDAAFVGDTLFMPDYGTARADFPGGDARQLFRSVRRILALPVETRLFMCHDYLSQTRTVHRYETTVGEQRRDNVHVRDGIDEDAFVAMREARDAGLDMPQLLLPAMQVNLRAGRFPVAEANGVSYLKIPIDQF